MYTLLQPPSLQLQYKGYDFFATTVAFNVSIGEALAIARFANPMPIAITDAVANWVPRVRMLAIKAYVEKVRTQN